MSRKAPMLLAAIAVIVALFATAAYAATIVGTPQGDKIFETQRNDDIRGRGGADDIRADAYGFDRDNLKGGTSRDELNARDGDDRDTLDGGPGTDKCKGDQMDTFISCELRP